MADAVVTDDEDETLDFLLTGRPLLHLAPDDAGDGEQARGGLGGHLPPHEILPGPVCRSFDELVPALDAVFDAVDAEHRVAYQRAVDLAFAHTDALSGWRLVEMVRRQYVDA